jgi:subtilisin family serine protease
MHVEFMNSVSGKKFGVRRKGVNFWVFILAVSVSLITASIGTQPAKEVRSEADLPRMVYPISGSVSSLLQADNVAFAPLLQKAAADIHSLLTEYDIKDRATLISVLSAKLATQELNGETDEAFQTIGALRALQQKPDLKLTAALFDEAILQAQQKTNASVGTAYEQAIESSYKEAVSALPWDVVQDTIKSARNTSALLTEAFLLGRAQEELQPEIDKSGGLDRQSFYRLLDFRVALRLKLPSNAIRSAVLDAYVAAHDTQKPDIWQARDVTLSTGDQLTEVRVGIFDSGVDPNLYPGQFYHLGNSEPYPSQGLAFTDEGYPSNDALMPLSPDQSKLYTTVQDDLEALSDLQAGIESPAGAAFKKRLPQLSKNDVEKIFKGLDFFGNYAHGTHVAGIAIHGNPAARIVVFRFNDGLSRDLDFPPSGEWAERMAANFRSIGTFCRGQNVRVVNMSWGDDLPEFEEWLARTKAGQDAEQRKEEASKLFAIWKQAIYETIKSAPDTLFITAAGNADSDTGFLQDIPASLELPNLMTVGATNQAGDATTFTSYGKTVIIYADGFHVGSYIPGGRRVRFSGTSMSSPAVANLAAKLLAIDPSLSPDKVRALILDGATPSEDGRRKLMNEQRSIELARLNKEKEQK